MILDFVSETKQARRKWSEIFKVLRGWENSRLMYPSKISFKNKEEIKTFLGKCKLGKFVTSISAL